VRLAQPSVFQPTIPNAYASSGYEDTNFLIIRYRQPECDSLLCRRSARLFCAAKMQPAT
jgi:hypothetical protein